MGFSNYLGEKLFQKHTQSLHISTWGFLPFFYGCTIDLEKIRSLYYYDNIESSFTYQNMNEKGTYQNNAPSVESSSNSSKKVKDPLLSMRNSIYLGRLSST